MKQSHQPVQMLSLTSTEVDAVSALLDSIMARHKSIDLDEFMLDAHTSAQELPRRIRSEVYRFKLLETSGVLCIKNNPLGAEFGPTPPELPPPPRGTVRVGREEVLHLLYSSLLGEPFGWTSIQNGRLINEVYPVQRNEAERVSSGSKYDLGLHTEDAFSPWTGDYLGLMCLRNPHRVSTRMSWVRSFRLPGPTEAILFEPRFRILPNQAHSVSPSMSKVPIFFGDRDRPYFRINLNVEDPLLARDAEAVHALASLEEALEHHAFDFVLDAADCCYIDNRTVAHGRKAYRPHYDGTDRWMKRLYITIDLRKTRHLRLSGEARIVRPENETERSSSPF